MKILLLSLVSLMLTTSCSERSTHAFYDMIHERERQECLKQGRSDCQRAESYNKYKDKREEAIKNQEVY